MTLSSVTRKGSGSKLLPAVNMCVAGLLHKIPLKKAKKWFGHGRTNQTGANIPVLIIPCLMQVLSIIVVQFPVLHSLDWE